MNTKLILCFYLSSFLSISAAFPDEFQTESLRQAINAWIDFSIQELLPKSTLEEGMEKIRKHVESQQIKKQAEKELKKQLKKERQIESARSMMRLWR